MSSLVVFSVDVHRLAAFYEAVLGIEPNHESSGDIRLLGDREEVLVHSVPAKYAKTIEVRTPPEPREGSAIKPVFEVESLEAALEQVHPKGGVVTGRTFSIDGLRRHDVVDPDGNVIQLRGRSS
jgi:predicted enzyme related to lactoylglutathione lyase